MRSWDVLEFVSDRYFKQYQSSRFHVNKTADSNMQTTTSHLLLVKEHNNAWICK